MNNKKKIKKIKERLNRNIMSYEERKKIIVEVLEFCEKNSWWRMNDTRKKTLINDFANYLIFSPDVQKIEREENFMEKVLEYKDFKKIIENETPTNDFLYVLKYFSNQRASSSPQDQIITSNDCERCSLLNDLQEFILFLRDKKDKSNDNNEKSILARHLKLTKNDQRIIKDSCFGTIYFKHIAPTSTCYSHDKIDLTNPEHIRNILDCFQNKEVYDLNNDLDVLFFDIKNSLDVLYKKEITKSEKEILGMFINGYSISEISSELAHYYNFVNRSLTTVSKKIANYFKKQEK